MARDDESTSDTKDVVHKHERYGFLAGLGLGLIVGVVIAGPFFYEWSLWSTARNIIACAAGGGVLGYFADSIAIGSVAGGSGDVGLSGFDHDSGHHSGGGSDGGHGGCGGDCGST